MHSPPSDILWTPPSGHIVTLHYEHVGDGGELAAGDGDGNSDQHRRELLARLARGDRVELSITAETYSQGPTVENTKGTEFSPQALQSLAKTADGSAFQRDHSIATVDCGGFVTGASRVEQVAGNRVLVETLRLVKPWAVEAALDGTMRHFSIAFRPGPGGWEDIQCTACKDSVLRCQHYAGQILETRGGKSTVVTYLYKSAKWRERSWIINPAISGTKPRTWEVLSDARAKSLPTRSKRKTMKTLHTLLNCDEDEDAIYAAAGQLSAKAARLEAEVEDLRASIKDKDTELAELADVKAELETRRKADRAAEADRLVTDLCADGRIRPGGKQEQLLRKRFESGDDEGARELAESYKENERIAPVATRQSSQVGAPPAATTATGDLDFQVLFDSLPEHIREGAGPRARDPESFIRRSEQALRDAGIALPALPPSS